MPIPLHDRLTALCAQLGTDLGTLLKQVNNMQASSGSNRAASLLASSTTLTVADINKSFSIGVGVTATLPLVSTCGNGNEFAFFSTANDAVIKTQSSNVIRFSSSTVTSLKLNAGDWCILVLIGTNWTVKAGSILNRIGTGNVYRPHLSAVAPFTFGSANFGNVTDLVTEGGVYTLPPTIGYSNGFTLYLRVNLASGNTPVTIVCSGTEDVTTGYSNLTSITMHPGDTLELISNGGGRWIMCGGSVMLPYSGTMKTASWVTQNQFDASARLATDEFVQRALGNYRFATSLVVTTSTTLTAAHVGSALQIAGPCVMPLGSTVTSGATITLYNDTTSSLPITLQGTDYFWMQGVLSTLNLEAGGWVVISLRANNQWDVIAGTPRLALSAMFKSVNGLPGYFTLPSGIIVQTCQVGNVNAGSSGTFSWPIAFPNNCFFGIAGPATAGGTLTPSVTAFGTGPTKTQFKIYNMCSVPVNNSWVLGVGN